MNRDECCFVDTWLDDWLAGRLPEEAARRIEQHVSGCGRCRRLVAILHDVEDDDAARAPEADLLSGVLERTTGSACSRAEGALPALVDDELDADSRDLVRAHVGRCNACARLLAALEESRQVLPSLAELEPPPGFATRVFALTSRHTRQPSLARWWQRILARPRASLELAYVATLLLVIVFGNPVSAFNEARDRAEQLAGSVPLARLTAPAAEGVAGTVARWIGGIATAANAVADRIAARWRDALALLASVEKTIAGAIDWVKTADWKQIVAPTHAPPQQQPARPSAGLP